MSKPASGRAAANASATCDSTVVRRAVPQFASIGVASTVCDRSEVERFDRRTARASPRLSRLADCFASTDAKAFAAFWRRCDPKYPFIPNGLRFDLSTAFRRGSVRFVAPTARPPTSRFSSQASTFEGVAKHWKTRQGRLRLASTRKLATENEKADGWTSTRRPAKLSSASRFETRS
ncbi:MAG: hypothetical protein IIW01_01060 [Thermoguttaceae bacterium]|nr:hypothetical protein [Thermoguttaceae bacterium]